MISEQSIVENKFSKERNLLLTDQERDFEKKGQL